MTNDEFEQELRDRVRAVLDGDLSLDDFDGWFVADSWLVRGSRVTDRVMGVLSRATSLAWSEDETREALARAVALQVRELEHDQVLSASVNVQSSVMDLRSTRVQSMQLLV